MKSFLHYIKKTKIQAVDHMPDYKKRVTICDQFFLRKIKRDFTRRALPEESIDRVIKGLQ